MVSPNNNVITAGGPPIWRKATYLTLAILTFLYFTITTILFYVRRRKISDIRYRPLRLNILHIIAMILLCVMACLRTAFYPNQYPCILIHWPVYIGFFLYCSSLTCRVISFFWIAKYNLAKLRMSVVYTPHQSSFNFSSLNSSNISKKSKNKNNLNIKISSLPTTPMSPGMREKLGFPGDKVMNRLKKFKYCTTDKWLAYWILCPTMGIAFILALVTQLTSHEVTIYPLNTICTVNGIVPIRYLPVYILNGVFLLIICPTLIYLLYDIRDGYGLRNELMVALFTGATAYAGYFIFELTLPRWKNYFGSLMFMWVAYVICHTLSTTVPLIRSFKYKTYSVPISAARGMIKRTLSTNRKNRNNNINGDGKSKRYIMFEKVLEDSELFELYKICAAACFCTELIIFLQEYQFLKMLVAHYCTPTNKEILPPSTPKVVITETGHISLSENSDLYPTTVPIVSPSFTTSPCTKSIVETVSAASWIPFPFELRADYNNFYETFFDSDSDLAINFPGSLLNDVKNMVKDDKYELTMYEQAREEVLNLLYRNTFERFLKMCGSELEKKGI
ncbi:hypothetical protein C1645_805477 [Glomus cerebriforme]|uniref:RGS domain-containing protein n=1 Tax=Glomus cerebriforme TaxID=658196 RepID=A0A397SY03_9GLOM|nr:hypothetical protein C1645_805477 [Glomus cerebriforme]